jgi:hypothetical protein
MKLCEQASWLGVPDDLATKALLAARDLEGTMIHLSIMRRHFFCVKFKVRMRNSLVFLRR